MLDYKLKIGLVPIRRDLADAKTRKGIFEPAKAEENKNQVLKFVKENCADELTSFADIEWLNEEGLLYSPSDCERVKEYFLKEKVDAIFLINCNFGSEEAAGTIAKLMGLPVLLWGPQDLRFDPDGLRYTDSQCGLFAISKQLQRYKIPFSYIENCPVESETFINGFKSFLSVATMVKNFKKLKITQVGTRLNPFKSVMSNELELTEKFGFNMQNVNMAQATAALEDIYANRRDKLCPYAEDVKKKYDKVSYALEEVNRKGYGIVSPSIDELALEEPEIVKQGSRFGVRLKASAPSIHMIRADIETEVSPIVGTEKQSEELVHYLLKEFEVDPQKIWESNIFGKSLHELVNEGLHNKLYHMPDDAQMKLQETLTKIINEGSGGLICIIL